MNPRSAGTKLYALTMFVAVSVLCGLLTAGLALPLTAVAGGAVKSAADSLENLPATLSVQPQAERSLILMSDGSLLAQFYDENRIYVTLDKISPMMQQAQLAIEDHRFYEHGAMDPVGTLRAVVSNSTGGDTQGGSTLTQQYVKQVLIEAAAAKNDQEGIRKAQEVTIGRKVRELRFAVALENKFTKDEILERYLNIAYYGASSYGVEAAAHRYFDTTAAKLTVAQSAMLAGIVQNPVANDPINNVRNSIDRRNVVLARMLELGSITQAEHDTAKNTKFDKKKVQPIRNGCVDSPYPFVCQYVYNTLISSKMPSLGKTPQERADRVNRGGLTIQTLVDPKAQQAAETAVASLVAPADPVIAVAVMIQPKTGLIVSMAQNRQEMGSKPGETWYNFAVDARLGGAEGYQAGSTFKAFTMAAALQRGFTPSKTYNAVSGYQFKGDTFKNCSGTFTLGESYTPKNSTGRSGRMNMVEAARWSVNTYFLMLERDTGICETVKMAERAGVQMASGGDLVKTYESVPSFTLGVAEVTPLSMAEAYATFANRGVHCDPIIIKGVKTKEGKSLAVPSADCKRVMQPEIADGVNYLLQQVMAPGGTGYRARTTAGYPQAGKTGTIDSAEAVWFNGYTPEMAGVAMIAADKTSERFKGKSRRSVTGLRTQGTDCGNSGCYLEGSGGGDAGRIWSRAMAAALKGKPKTPFTSPTDTVLNGKKVQVPDANGLGFEGARAKLNAAGFSTTVSRIYSNSPQGYYLGYSPRRGTWVRQGDQITLYLSLGPRPQPKPQPKPPPKPPPAATQTAAPKPTTNATTKPAATATVEATEEPDG